MAHKERSPRPPTSSDFTHISPTDTRGHRARFEQGRYHEDEDISEADSTVRRSRPPAIATSINTLGLSTEGFIFLNTLTKI